MRPHTTTGIEAGAALLPLLPQLCAAAITPSGLETPGGRAALGLVVAVGTAGLPQPRPLPQQPAGLLPPLYRDPGAVVTPLLLAATEV